jgi:hypothetical protein
MKREVFMHRIDEGKAGVRPSYSALAPDSFATLAHLLISATSASANSACTTRRNDSSMTSSALLVGVTPNSSQMLVLSGRQHQAECAEDLLSIIQGDSPRMQEPISNPVKGEGNEKHQKRQVSKEIL